jgi:putative hydrolase of the HAD superfamily
MDEIERRRLTALIQGASAPLEPEPPVLPPEWEEPVSAPSGAIRAVLFDVYGTLFCSAAGDISFAAKEGGGGAPEALNTLARQYGLSGEGLRSFFREKVAESHRERRGLPRAGCAGIQWPEVQVEEIWAAFLRERGLCADAAVARELALRYELAVNPVYPMPHAAAAIEILRQDHVLGLVSNAQFFTPLLFDAFWGAPPELLGFDPALLVWSFEWGEAKPSPRLFEIAARALAERGIGPGETVFVGNDMLSDMYGAIQAGFRGVLFAGDSRSLRLRQGEDLTRGLRPFRVIRDLAELAGLC